MKIINKLKDRWIYTQQIKIFKKRRKPRYVHQGSLLIRFLSRFCANRIRKRLITKDFKNLRIRQLQNDLRGLVQFKYGWFIDVTNCFESCRVEAILKEFDQDLTSLEKRLIRLIFSSQIVNRPGLNKEFLRPGLQISEILFELIIENVLKKQESFDVDFASYVDDLRFFGNNRKQMHNYSDFIKEYLAKFNLEVYGEERKDKNSGMIDLGQEGAIGERLGILFRNHNGAIVTRVRSSTKRRYLGRIKEKVIASKNFDEAIDKVRKVLRNERFGIYSVFPFKDGLWTDKVDRTKFKIEVVRIIKKRYRTPLNGFEIFKLINAKL